MISIKRFLIDNKKDSLFSNSLYPTFTFVIENDDNLLKVDQIVLKVNGHEIDASELTRYTYEFDDLDYQSVYEASIEVRCGEKVVKETLCFETPLKEWDTPFISDPSYTFTEKKVSPKVIAFRKDFNLKKKVIKARAYFTAFGVYDFYLNGKKVNQEYLLPGFTSYKHQLQYQTFDIVSFLEEKNEILLDVAGGWAVGSFVMSRKNRISEDKQSISGKIVLTYEDGETETIKTDESWKTTTRTPYLYASLYDGEGFDATIDHDDFHNAAIYQTRNNPSILCHYGAPIVRKDTRKPTYLFKIGDAHIYDFGQNFAGVVSFKINNGKLGQRILVKHAEILKSDKSLNTSFLRSAKSEVLYVCKDGEQTYSPSFSYMGFRYISIEGIEPKEIEVEAFVLSSNNEEISTFECDNPLINRLNENIRWSSLSNFMDIPTDCPQRDERMGWTGDIAVFADTALYNFDLEAFLNKWLKDLRAEQLPSGGIPNTIPSQGYGFPETMPKMAVEFWGDACIFVPLALYKVNGDINVLKDNYETMKKYVKACLFWASFLSVGNHRYIWHTPSIFHFGDWVAPDVPKMSQWQGRSIYTATCSLKNSLTLLSSIAEKLGYEEDSKKYLELSKKVSKAFNKVLTNGNGITKKEFQTAYVLPLQFEMFEGEAKQNALNRLVKIIEENEYRIGTGFPGTPYILFVLADNGRADVAYKMLLNEKCPSWLYEAKVGGTTIWERWNGLDENGACSIKEDGKGGMISYNHYASGAVGRFLYSRLAGIEALTPGYKKIRVAPLLCEDIRLVKTSTLTPYGNLEVKYEIKDKFRIEVKVPYRSECELHLPNGEIVNLEYGKHSFERDL